MAIQTTFKRYEIKYLITKQQKEQILIAMKPYMKCNSYGHSTIRNIYFDTKDFRLIRKSLEKPVYKEKLRIRSYKQVTDDDIVFIELKKKYQSIVYKRRLTMKEQQTRFCFKNNLPLPVQSQIGNEIAYFRFFYKNLSPTVFLSYERDAYEAMNGKDFRVTFDENILYRTNDFSLGSEIYGTPILDDEMCLMEIKTSEGMPLWMSQMLSALHIYKSSFSKYGVAYQYMMKGV